jgi:PAS domain S-box-containing protein
MNSPLRIVLIDDNPDDRSLVARELRKEFPYLEIEEVHDSAGVERILAAAAEVDLVITDYQLGWTTGNVIVKDLKERCPDCPVLMFTGTGNEEAAVEAMKLGVEDYVLKSPRQYSRVAVAARAAIKAGAHKRELKQAENRYANLFNSIPVGLYTATPSGEILEANPALLSMLGYASKGELSQTTLSALHLSKADYEKWRELMERSGETSRYEAQLRCKDGRLCWVEVHARAIRHPSTRQIIYEGSMEDITERKVAEQERENLIEELQEALAKVKTLSGLLPICAACKKIRDSEGDWNQIEVYIQEHSDAAFTHGFCPECAERLYPEIFSPRSSK